MGSLDNPKPWVPYTNTKDCSQGFCSLYCPQWCYIIFPPPPPLEFPGDSSGPTFSPLVIAIIGILASAFLLVSYYAIISKYCGRLDSPRRRRDQNREPSDELVVEENIADDDDPSNHEPWHVPTTGLDEALIKSITAFKYKKGDGLIDQGTCSVCLGEFQEDESLRLLPKCTHAFHVTCIDTWLKSHSNCPLCRAIINVSFNSSSPPLPLAPPLPPPVTEQAPPSSNESLSDIRCCDGSNNENTVVAEDTEMAELEGRDIIVEIREEEEDGHHQRIRRSVSMSYLHHCRVSIADVLRLKQDEDFQVEACGFSDDVGTSSRQPGVEISKCSHENRAAQHCVLSPVLPMKRSFSSGRFTFSRRGRGKNIMIPL